MTDIFLSDGGSKYPALKFENVNDTHSGTVIEVKKLEDRDPSGTVKTWDNGDVRYVFVFTMKEATWLKQSVKQLKPSEQPQWLERN